MVLIKYIRNIIMEAKRFDNTYYYERSSLMI